MNKRLSTLNFIIALALTGVASTAALGQEFYQGKTIRVVVGFSAGGGFDAYSRTIARHLGKHTPGNPTVIVENMPGAGSLIAANHVYKVARPDGLTIGNFVGYSVLGQILGRPGIEYDVRRFEWIGLPVSDTGACALTRASGTTSLEEWQNSKTPVKLGVVGPGDGTYNSAKILKDVLGLPVHIVSGYKGTAEIRLAAESGEVAGGCWQWEPIKATWRKALDTGEAVVVLQFTATPHPDLAKVPQAVSLAKTDEARLLLQAAIHDPNTITRPYVLSPGTPKDRVEITRKAFMATMRDPEFLADAKKAKLDIDAMTGEEVEKIVARYFKLDPAIVARLKTILN
jgi:tripartite-type tricarboxylate transporter receptor subunit TctC